MIPWDQLFEAIGPQVATTVALAAIVIIAFYRGWVVTGPTHKRVIDERDGERKRAEVSESKTLSLYEEQLRELREEKRITQLIAEGKKQAEWESRESRGRRETTPRDTETGKA